MVLVKILGGIDIAGAIAFLILIFGLEPLIFYLLFCAGLLFIKGLFALMGDILSFVDLASALLLILSIFIVLPSILLWIPAFLLLSKGVVSFF